MSGRLKDRAHDIRRHNGVAPTAELLGRAASCIEVMARDAAADQYARMCAAPVFRKANPNELPWVAANWVAFVPEEYRDLIGGGV